MEPAVLQMENINMEFSGVYVLSDMQFRLEKGTIHALVGENGAGKSTLIKILGGIYKPHSGRILINGVEADINSVHDAREKGISIIHQEISLVPYLSIAENLFLGREVSKHGMISKKTMMIKAQQMIDDLGIEMSADSMVCNLTIAQQQLVEIVKAVSFNTRIIVMDEPTSSLSLKETERLFEIIDRLKKNGVSIIYISHRMEEIFQIADYVTVIRDGKYIDTKPAGQTDANEIVGMMVGRKMEQYYIRTYNELKDTAFEVSGLTKAGAFEDISFKVRKGEILGFAGLVGSGRSEIMHSIFGADAYDSGEILLNGQKIKFKNPREAILHGVGMVPESRKEQGLVIVNTVGFNLVLTALNKIRGKILISNEKKHDLVLRLIERMRIKTQSEEQFVFELSGGNQQKIVLSKWLANNPEVLILDEPTRGVDVGAKSEIYTIINELAAKGMAIIMVSSELTEIINMCDNVCVVHEGKIAGKLSKDEFTQDRIMQLATGGEPE